MAWNLVASAYAEEVVPLFSRYAEDALRIAGVGAGQDVLDVATGPGTLAVLAARRGARVSAIDFAEAMVGKLRARIDAEAIANVEARVGDGHRDARVLGDEAFHGSCLLAEAEVEHEPPTRDEREHGLRPAFHRSQEEARL